MISRCLLMALSIAVFSPGFTRAQQVYPYSQKAADSTNYDKMYEDIEILRRILDRKLEPLYPTHSYKNSYESIVVQTLQELTKNHLDHETLVRAKSFLQRANLPNQESIRSLEGVYVTGQGVVYTAILSSLQPPAETKAAPQVSEWENARRQVRDEKEEPKKKEASKPPALSDVLLKVLAENGHHFSQLGANESLTLVITVRKGRSTESPKFRSGSTKESASSPTSGDDADSARKLEMLGDLHQKQGRYAEAIIVFRKAEERNPDPNAMLTLDRKLAQCHLALGEDEMARKALDHIRSLQKKDHDTADVPAAGANPTLPAKLIVSASKKLLDEAKGSKISFEEFRRRAHVETLRFGDRR